MVSNLNCVRLTPLTLIVCSTLTLTSGCNPARDSLYASAAVAGVAIITNEFPPAKETKEQRQARIEAMERRAERDAESAERVWRETGNLTYLERLASDGDRKAADELKRINALKQKAEWDVASAAQWARDTGDPSYLERLQEKGYPDATAELNEFFATAAAAEEYARKTGELKYLKQLAENGNQNAQFGLYQLLSNDRKTIRVAWINLCEAANRGHGFARIEVGWWHIVDTDRKPEDEEKLQWLQQDLNLEPDQELAKMWAILAEPPYTENSPKLAVGHDRSAMRWVATEFIDGNTARAKPMAERWKRGDCPSPTNRLPPPGDT